MRRTQPEMRSQSTIRRRSAITEVARLRGLMHGALPGLTFDMSGGFGLAQPAQRGPLDGGVRSHSRRPPKESKRPTLELWALGSPHFQRSDMEELQLRMTLLRQLLSRMGNEAHQGIPGQNGVIPTLDFDVVTNAE